MPSGEDGPGAKLSRDRLPIGERFAEGAAVKVPPEMMERGGEVEVRLRVVVAGLVAVEIMGRRLELVEGVAGAGAILKTDCRLVSGGPGPFYYLVLVASNRCYC